MKSKGAVDTTTIPVHAIDDLVSDAVIEQRPLAVAVKKSIRSNGTGLSSNVTSDEPESAWAAEQRRRIAAAKAALENFERKRLAHLSEHERAVIGDLEARCLAIAKRNRKFDLINLSSMGTLATAKGIASAIAARHKISEIEVFTLGANYLREATADDGRPVPASRETAFLARSLVMARAGILIERSRATALLRLKDAMWDENVSEIQLRADTDEAERLRLKARIETQSKALAKGRAIANENRIQLGSTRQSDAKRLFQEWRAHSENATADNDVGYAYVANVFNQWGYVTTRGAKFKVGTIKEYFRRPRQT